MYACLSTLLPHLSPYSLHFTLHISLLPLQPSVQLSCRSDLTNPNLRQCVPPNFDVAQLVTSGSKPEEDEEAETPTHTHTRTPLHAHTHLTAVKENKKNNMESMGRKERKKQRNKEREKEGMKKRTCTFSAWEMCRKRQRVERLQ